MTGRPLHAFAWKSTIHFAQLKPTSNFRGKTRKQTQWPSLRKHLPRLALTTRSTTRCDRHCWQVVNTSQNCRRHSHHDTSHSIDNGKNNLDSGEVAQNVWRGRSSFSQKNHSFSLSPREVFSPLFSLIPDGLHRNKAGPGLMIDPVNGGSRIVVRHQDRWVPKIGIAFTNALNRGRSCTVRKRGRDKGAKSEF